jgi:arylsulfatase A-like enzyme
MKDHTKFGKSAKALHAFNTQVNMLVRHPHGPRNKVVDALVQHIDLAPTILSWLGVRHERLDGENMWHLATGQRDRLRDHAIIAWTSEVSVRDATWNAVVNVQATEERWQLHRIDRDRNSPYDVAAEHPEVVALQRERLESLLGAPLPAWLPARQPQSEYPLLSFRKARASRMPHSAGKSGA